MLGYEKGVCKIRLKVPRPPQVTLYIQDDVPLAPRCQVVNPSRRKGPSVC